MRRRQARAIHRGMPRYFDFNSTTPVLPQVLEAMLPYLTTHFGNASSGHAHGQAAKAGLERARAQVAAALGAQPDEVLFTSGGTEATNLALWGALGTTPRRRVVAPLIEHAATLAPLRAREDVELRLLPVDAQGRTRTDGVRDALGDAPALLTVMHANNETGVLQPVRALADAAHAAGALVHTDVAQSLGKVPVNMDALGVDLASVAGHKLHAPKGIGALFMRRGVRLSPFTRGAAQERGLRPGTEPVALAVALGEACALVTAELEATAQRLSALRALLERRLREQVPGLVVHGADVERLPNTSSVRFPKVSGTALLQRTPELSASTGAACHAGQESASAVILALGVTPQEALGTVRLSLGRPSTEEDVVAASDALARSWRALVGS